MSRNETDETEEDFAAEQADEAQRMLDAKEDIVCHAVKQWRIARTKQLLAFAEGGAWGETGDDMRGWEEHLTCLTPKTVEGVVALLSMVVEILATKAADPEASLAKGPVLEMASRAWKALEEMPLAARPRRRRPVDAFGEVSGAPFH